MGQGGDETPLITNNFKKSLKQRESQRTKGGGNHQRQNETDRDANRDTEREGGEKIGRDAVWGKKSEQSTQGMT